MFAFDLLHLDGKDLRRTPLLKRRAALCKLIEPDCRSPIQFSDHVNCGGAVFFKAAADLGLENRLQAGDQPLPRWSLENWLKTKNMVEGEFLLLSTEIDNSGIPWALLGRELDGRLEFAGPAILRSPSSGRAEWAEKLAAMAMEKPAINGLKRVNKAQWLRPEIRVRARYLKAKGTLRHATVKALIEH